MNPTPDNRQPALRLIEEITESPPMSLSGAENLSEVKGWDSLAAIGFISAAHKRFSIVVSPAKLVQARSVADLVRLVTEA